MKKRLLSMILAGCLCLTSLTGCGQYLSDLEEGLESGFEEIVEQAENLVTKLEQELNSDSEVSSLNKDEDDELVIDSTVKTEIPDTFPEYTLTEEDIADFEEQLLLCEELLRTGADYETLEAAADELDEIGSKIQDQGSVAEVLYYCDMKNEDAVDAYLFSQEVSSEVWADYIGFMVEFYESDVPEYRQYFEDLSELERKVLESYSAETVELEVRNAEILTEFYDLEGDEFEEEIGSLYSEFITNSNQIAEKCGYTNYYEYSTELTYVRDYGREERELFRKYVKDYVVPIYNVAYDTYAEAYKTLSKEDKRVLNDIMHENYNALSKDYMEAYFASLNPHVTDGMQHMFQNENYIMTNYKYAYEGAFTIDIEKPFCFFGPDYQTAFIIIHELGHYYADLAVDTSWLSFDLLETHSQGNEMLFLSYLEEELSPDVYKALVAYQLYYFTDTIVQSAIMDEFEEFVYNDPDTADYTTEDYDRIMYEIIAGYGIDDSDTYTFSCMEWLWRNVGISSPVYYLSYGVSAMASLNLYSQSAEDYDAAVEAYQKLQEEVDFERSFIGTLENAGIRSVFDEEAYIALFDIFEEI